MPETLEVKCSSLQEENSVFSEIKGSEMEIKVKGTNEKPEDERLDEKIPEEIHSPTVQI